MKVILRAFSALILLLSLTGCGRDLGLTTSDGTYLQMKVRFPETEGSDSSRLIHSEADELTVSLTYPDGFVDTATFPRNEDSEMTIQVDDLTVASNVVVKVTLGIDEYDLILTEATKTIDIVEGANSTGTMIMEAIDYTVSGTLYDKDNNLLPGTTILVKGGEPITSDASGKFSMTVSTANPSNVNVFSVDVGGDHYDMTRTNLALLQNHENFTLKASHEIYLDFLVGCELYPLPGTSFEVFDTVTGLPIEGASGVSDSNGRVSYQNSNYSSGNAFEVRLSYNSMFLDKTIYSTEESLAAMTVKNLDPYIFYYISAYGGGSNGYVLYRNQEMSNTNEVTKNLTDVFNANHGTSVSFNDIHAMTCDYLNNKIYIFVTLDDGSSRRCLWRFDGWDDNAGALIDVDPGFFYGNSTYSVQQIDLLNDGTLLLSTSRGCYTYDFSNELVLNKWEVSDTYSFVTNGAFQDANGDLFIMGLDRRNGDDADKVLQKIWNLSSDNSWSLSAELPSDINDFIGLSGSLSSYVDYNYLMGMHKWNSIYVSLNVYEDHSTSAYGSVRYFSRSDGTWQHYGSPFEEPEEGKYRYFYPMGVLPDNKYYFYCVEDLTETRLFRLDSPEDTNADIYSFYSNSSPSEMFRYSYNEGA